MNTNRWRLDGQTALITGASAGIGLAIARKFLASGAQVHICDVAAEAVQAAVQAHPTLMRPITLVNERYNQHLTRGSLIIEVGSSGNTLQEATRAVRLFGESAGPALARLVQ